MTFSILFDNYTSHPELKALWGFSCYIPELKLLFDTGSNGRVLLQNAQKMGVDLKEVRYLFLSHPHWDHIGGLDSVLEINPNVTLFLPDSFSPRLIKDLRQFAYDVVVVGEEPMELFDGCYSTGVMGNMEHALVVEGGYLLTGCSHPGILAIVQRAHSMIGAIRYLLGGFHLFREPLQSIESVAEELSQRVECVTPTHCSGALAMEIFARFFGSRYRRGGVGEVIEC